MMSPQTGRRMATERRPLTGSPMVEHADAALVLTSPGAEAAVAAVDRNVGSVTDALRRALIGPPTSGCIRNCSSSKHWHRADWTLANTAARDWANRYVGELIGGIRRRRGLEVRQAVAAWVDNGQPLEALIRELEPTFRLPRRVDRQHRR